MSARHILFLRKTIRIRFLSSFFGAAVEVASSKIQNLILFRSLQALCLYQKLFVGPLSFACSFILSFFPLAAQLSHFYPAEWMYLIRKLPDQQYSYTAKQSDQDNLLRHNVRCLFYLYWDIPI